MKINIVCIDFSVRLDKKEDDSDAKQLSEGNKKGTIKVPTCLDEQAESSLDALFIRENEIISSFREIK